MQAREMGLGKGLESAKYTVRQRRRRATASNIVGRHYMDGWRADEPESTGRALIQKAEGQWSIRRARHHEGRRSIRRTS